MTFLFLGEDGKDGSSTAARRDCGFAGPLTSLRRARRLPPEARDTGYRRDGRELWVTTDGRAAYLVQERR